MSRREPTLYERLTTRRAVRIFWIVVIAPFALLLFLLGLTSLGTFGRLPSFEELENPKSNVASEIIGEDGKLLGTFFIENRTFVGYEELTRDLVAALVSTEDVRFYGHSGIDYISLARVALRTVGLGQNQGGGSTITQQLAKNLFKREGWIVTDKLKEWVIAIKLEHNYTKEEIISMYLNTMFYGHNAYGIKTAANAFFGKTPGELNIQESATLVGVVNAPTRYSPVSNPRRAVERRNTVLRRMEGVGYISGPQYDSLSVLPIELDYHPVSHDQGSATYFREMLRLVMQAEKPVRSRYPDGTPGDFDFQYELHRWETNPLYGWIHKNRKADGTPYDIYRDGLKIYTTINSSMQRYAEEAVAVQMRAVQPNMERQFRSSGVIFQGKSKTEVAEYIARLVRDSDRYRAMEADGASTEQIKASFDVPVEMSLFTYGGMRDTIITPRDSIIHFQKLMRSSFVAIEPRSGHVKAYVGGPDFRFFKYDMAKQGKRQCGSTIKPFVYTFAFSQYGLDPCTPVPNLQVTIETTTGTPWTPKEASRVEYNGDLHPVKWGLAHSRNNYTAWVMKQIGSPEMVADFINNMGIRSYIYPAYALSLGTMDVSLFELVGAYTTFANRGMSTEPIFVVRIEDRQGNLISSFLPDTHEAVNERTAYTTLTVLEDVVNSGTGNRLRWAYGFTGEIAGKTGTSQENRDAWFVGVTPNLVAGAWFGGEDQSVHPRIGGEGSAMALPIYGEFMKRVYADPKLGVRQTDTFEVPPGGGIGCAGGESLGLDSAPRDDEFFD
ncbi:MAG: transglycosylase domain-containing protein [Alistipes sp.]|jgi:penicillin-binding protein 1A|nr:transglycosylase domain-containing protein [Alistipes sp.]